MDVHDLALTIHAAEYASPTQKHRTVQRVHASDTMSELIAHASFETLLVTSLNNCQLVRVAELMDVPGICLTANAVPSPDLIDRAAEAGTTILVSPLSLIDTFSALHRALGLSQGACT